MDNIYEWIYGVIDTKRSKKHKISNEFCISKYLSVYINRDKDSIENQIPFRIWKIKKRRKMEPTPTLISTQLILKLYPLFISLKKLNGNVKNCLICPKSNKNLIKALKFNLIYKYVSYQNFHKRRTKISK